MTDSIIQFKYSDDVFMTGIYIKSDTHQEKFIPLLLDIVKSCEHINNRRGWAYVVAEIVAKITNKHDESVTFILESQIETSFAVYKYSVTVSEDLYSDKENRLIDYLKIKYFHDEDGFDGLLKDFEKKITSQDNQYRIDKLENDIKEKQKELKNLKTKLKK